MPIYISYLVVPIVIFLLGINVYFRLKIIKQYKQLKAKRIEVDSLPVFNQKKMQEVLGSMNASDGQMFQEFVNNINRLIKVVCIGFVSILGIFLYIYFAHK